MTEFSFEKANISDVLRLSVLLKTVYIQTYGLEGVTFEFANFIEKRFSLDYLKTAIIENPDQLLVGNFRSNPVGVAEVLYESTCPVRKTVVPELSKLYVLQRFYSRGVGFGLLQAVEKELIARELNELNLEVLIENERAIAFYKKQGFEIIGEADFPMEFNTYRNFVMNKQLR